MQRGFTLVELLVVFALMALLVTIVPSSMQRLQSTIHYQKTVQSINQQLRQARRNSLLEGKDTAFFIDVKEKSYGIIGLDTYSFSDDLNVEALTAQEAFLNNGSQAIIFIPRGGSTGGSISIKRKINDQGIRLRVDWLSGLVTQEPL